MADINLGLPDVLDLAQPWLGDAEPPEGDYRPVMHRLINEVQHLRLQRENNRWMIESLTKADELAERSMERWYQRQSDASRERNEAVQRADSLQRELTAAQVELAVLRDRFDSDGWTRLVEQNKQLSAIVAGVRAAVVS